jgi:DNA polymerase-3 subunit epsilon
MRQVVLDTETTGLELLEGHKIIEIGCVEMINRRLTGNNYHQYINPDREIDAGAIEVHGITTEQLKDKPRFRDIAQDFLDFVKGAELIIHNAPFDVGFLNHEFSTGGHAKFCIDDHCTIIDTLKLARAMHPGQKNDLDSLCRRYSVDNSTRTLHGALLDAEILADVYIAMTRSQAGLFEDTSASARTAAAMMPTEVRRLIERPSLVVLGPTPDELALHAAWLDEIEKKSGGKCLWKRAETTET